MLSVFSDYLSHLIPASSSLPVSPNVKLRMSEKHLKVLKLPFFCDDERAGMSSDELTLDLRRKTNKQTNNRSVKDVHSKGRENARPNLDLRR